MQLLQARGGLGSPAGPPWPTELCCLGGGFAFGVRCLLMAPALPAWGTLLPEVSGCIWAKGSPAEKKSEKRVGLGGDPSFSPQISHLPQASWKPRRKPGVAWQPKSPTVGAVDSRMKA